MKKLLFLAIFSLMAVVSYCQPNGNQQENNITIRNSQPMLHLRGEGAVINFYNGDLRLTRSSNALTLTGGIFKIGTDTTATRAYARSVGGGGTWGGITGTLANQLDLQAALDLKANLASPTFTGIPRAPTAALGTNTTQLATTAFTIAQAGDQINDTLESGESLSSVAPLLVDTIPLVTFGLGSDQTGDTAVFVDNALAGSFYNEGSDTLVITQLMGIITSGTGTETVSVQVSWHATFKSGSATNLNAAALAITSITTGTADVSFANAKIPPDVFVWCTISGVSAGNRPQYLNVTLSGYKIPTY